VQLLGVPAPAPPVTRPAPEEIKQTRKQAEKQRQEKKERGAEEGQRREQQQLAEELQKKKQVENHFARKQQEKQQVGKPVSPSKGLKGSMIETLFDNGEWYAGVVGRYSVSREAHRVDYDDGEESTSREHIRTSNTHLSVLLLIRRCSATDVWQVRVYGSSLTSARCWLTKRCHFGG
jgi:hypothetical protein